MANLVGVVHKAVHSYARARDIRSDSYQKGLSWYMLHRAQLAHGAWLDQSSRQYHPLPKSKLHWTLRSERCIISRMTPISPLYFLQDMFHPACLAYLDRFPPLPTCARGIWRSSRGQTPDPPEALRICFREFADQLPKQFRFRTTSLGSDF
jgi:hypothetical protein